MPIDIEIERRKVASRVLLYKQYIIPEAGMTSGIPFIIALHRQPLHTIKHTRHRDIEKEGCLWSAITSIEWNITRGGYGL